MAKYNKHVIITGTARSGTSWLSETIAQQFRYRMLFEPEHETRTKQGHLLCDKLLEKSNESIDVKNYLNRLFKNQVDCDWIAQNSNRRFKQHLWPLVPKKIIIKFVRANLASNYFNECFGIPVIFLLRNPYDVIRSQQQVKFPWLFDLSRFTSQDKLVGLIQDKFNYDIKDYKHLSKLEVLTLRWCIENVIPIETLPSNKNSRTVVKYEDLVANIKEFYSLCDKYDIKPIKNLENYYKLPSSKTHPMSSKQFSSKKNLSYFSKTDKMKVNRLLDVFETRLYERG